ncbi:MAG: pilus assembly protein [Ignavibacteria bacterium]
MNILRNLRWLALAMSVWVGFYPVHGLAEDIDIFVGSSAGTSASPNVLIVLDNTSNWARQNQKWPGGLQQGQSEVRAIKTVLSTLSSNINVGMMEFVTGGNANDQGGFIRYAIRPMNSTNQTTFSTQLTNIFNAVTSVNEKRNSNTAYGDLMYDVYNYYAGAAVSNDGSNHSATLSPPNPSADTGGYTTNYSQFRSPLSADSSCAKNFIIFISNPNSSGPAADTSYNTAALSALGGSTAQLSLPNFSTSTVAQATLLYKTSACYSSQAACSAAEASNSAYTSVCPPNTTGSYDSCSCAASNDASNPATSTMPSCATGQRYSVVATSNTVTTGPTAGASTTSTGTSTGCYASQTAANTAAAAGTDKGGLTCPATTTSTVGGTTTTTTYSCGYSAGATTSAGTACSSTTTNTGPTTGSAVTSTALSTSCYTGISTGSTKWNSSSDHGTLSCPSTTTTTSGYTTTTTSYVCSYSGAMSGNTTGCSSGKQHVTVTQSATPTVSTVTNTPNSRYVITQTATPYVSTSTAGVGTSTLGNTQNCYPDLASCSTADYAAACSAAGTTCACSAAGATTTGSCPSGLSYSVVGTANVLVNTPTGTSTLDTNPFNADEWARFLFQTGVPVSGTSTKQTVSTYTIDVYNAQPNAQNTSLMMSMARAGGGKYFNATNETALVNALKSIFNEIQSVNSTFASASLPINATNRAQNENQVFIGMFRPDPDAKPRWFGNVKRYQLVKDANGDIQLGDYSGNVAINNNTGFITDCATSWWTFDSSTYWSNYSTVNPAPVGTCPTTSYSAYSDSPDGPRVEKGAVAEVIRWGNNPNSRTRTWTSGMRTMYSASGASLTSFSAAAAGVSSDTADWIMGKDASDESGNYENDNDHSWTRASIHGDVIHSRPLPVNYCTTSNCSNVVLYYGSNDGTLRAVDAATGKEKWAFVAPEFGSSRFERLRTQSPLVNYPGVTATPTPTARDYFFDGSIGIYQTATNNHVWIFPTMRRGGRTIYALDVTDADAPSIKWKVGCPNLSDDTGCSSGATAIGQTWSIPNVAFIRGYSTSTPVAVVGGGYDSCEDTNSSITTQCASTKGNVVYVINASSGAIVKSFTTLRAVASDVALVDMDYDGNPDYAYFGDTGGNLYRISFSTYDPSTGTYTALESQSWVITRVAYTSGGGRKFQFAPALFGGAGTVYIALGSGDREHPLQTQYPYTTPVTNRFYVYRDCLAATPDSSSIAGGNSLDDTTLMTNATTNPSCGGTQTTTSNCSTNKGWFTDLNNGTGEQTVTSAVIVGGMVTFSTNRPIPAAAGSCSTALGEAAGYWLNLYNGSGAVGVTGNCGGTKSTPFVGGGLPPSPVVGTVPINGVPTSVVIGAAQRSGTASSPISPQKATPTNLPARKRVYSYTHSD